MANRKSPLREAWDWWKYEGGLGTDEYAQDTDTREFDRETPPAFRGRNS